MKTPLTLAQEFVRVVDALNSVPGMMTTHDLGKEAIARSLVSIANAYAEREKARSVHEDSEDASSDYQTVIRAEIALEDLLRELASRPAS